VVPPTSELLWQRRGGEAIAIFRAAGSAVAGLDHCPPEALQVFQIATRRTAWAERGARAAWAERCVARRHGQAARYRNSTADRAEGRVQALPHARRQALHRSARRGPGGAAGLVSTPRTHVP